MLSSLSFFQLTRPVAFENQITSEVSLTHRETFKPVQSLSSLCSLRDSENKEIYCTNK